MSTEIVQAQQTAVAGLSDAPMPIDAVMQQIGHIQQVMARAMRAGEHYGVIPGCNKPSLLKPGAEKLSMTFRLAPSYRIETPVMPRDHREYRVICMLTHIPSGMVYGEGVGSCSTMESKYRYRNAAKKCPECGKETIIKGKAEYGGGWLCFNKRGGCGAKWKDGDAIIEDQADGKVEHDNPADYYNTCLKMAKKRAHVDACLTVTAASDIFSQDVEDMDLGAPASQQDEKTKAINAIKAKAANLKPEELDRYALETCGKKMDALDIATLRDLYTAVKNGSVAAYFDEPKD